MSVAEKMTAIADAIREKTGDTGKLSLDGMAEALRKLPGPIVATASGNPISLSDATDLKLRGLKLFGKTTQNGIPTPVAPVPLVSAGDGGAISITISGENAQTQTLPVSAPNGLPGIPVTSGGNYTDETGQQWVCDEVDFGRGVYVQKILSVTDISQYGVTVAAPVNGYTEATIRVRIPFENAYANCMCSHFKRKATADSEYYVATNDGTIYIKLFGEYTADTWKAKYAELSPTILLCLATPIETALSAEELAAYAALHTNYPNSTILNDGGAGMEVKYVADTKNYIDNQIAAISAAIVNS